MSHNRIYRHLAFGLFSFCFSAASFATCGNANVSKCVGSSKEIQLTVKARLQEASCNVSLGSSETGGEKSLTFDFGNVLRSGLSYKINNYLAQYLYIALKDCNDMFNKAQITFNADTCTTDNKVACDGVHWAGVKIKDDSDSEVEFNKWNDLVLTTNTVPLSARYRLYLVKTDGSSENYSQAIQIIVRYN
ncbi:hypothetical protein FDX24_11350 [Citrobacter sp. wls716]|uniref:fimbrial protein n=1 Tax=Citrobacter sp. wls716 TaxID=2576420 RepID=UPI0010C9753F|nr:hypothetical protein [Citrobacter sp. wls716]TKU40892.1 hypothetical protein FDX24_11350 [Citrobacter sp. wls716]